MADRLADIADAIAGDGFAYVQAPEMRGVLEQAGLRDWDGFARSWDDLGLDTYMADGGRYRRRRFACFRASAEGIARKPQQPHYQSRDYNPLHGGIERWFEPVTEGIGHHPAMRAVLGACHALFDGLTSPPLRPEAWHVAGQTALGGPPIGLSRCYCIIGKAARLLLPNQDGNQSNGRAPVTGIAEQAAVLLSQPPSMHRMIVAAMIGNVLEWFDFVVYG